MSVLSLRIQGGGAGCVFSWSVSVLSDKNKFKLTQRYRIQTYNITMLNISRLNLIISYLQIFKNIKKKIKTEGELFLRRKAGLKDWVF